MATLSDTSLPLKPARRSRNSIFSDSWSFSSPTTSSPVLGSSPTGSPLLHAVKRRPSPPTVRIEPPQPSTSRLPLVCDSPLTDHEARVDAWDTIKPVDLSVPVSPNLSLKTIPSRPYLLGVGRHASVFLAACAAKDENWRPCAAKRMNADRESQLGGFREAYILSRLYDGGKGPKSILRLLALRDERDAGGQQRTVTHRAREHGRSNSEAGGHDLQNTSLPSALPPEMARAGSQSTPNSPTVASSSTMAPPAANVRRAFSMRVPTTPHVLSPRHEKRLSWASDGTANEVTDPPRLVLVLELCPEGNLSTLLQKRPEIIGRRLWLKWAKALAEAVAHAHQMGFMHADIKPGNVMLTADLDVRLADWGMSLPIQPDRLPTEGLGLGTTLYCAPEMVQAPPFPFSFPADIFSLGVTFNVLITGREPYKDARSPVEQMLWVSRGSYWQFEERYRMNLIGSSTLAHSGSAQSLGGLSKPTSDHGGSRPPSRVSSIRSLRSLVTEAEVPAPDLQELLGSESSRDDLNTARMALSNAAAGGSFDDGETEFPSADTSASLVATYSDGTPIQYFLDGREPVPEGVRLLLKRMTLPDPAARPTAKEVLNMLAVF